MKTTILGQGVTASVENTVGRLLLKFLEEKQYHSFMAISAFASEAAINGLSEYIEKAKETFKKPVYFSWS